MSATPPGRARPTEPAGEDLHVILAGDARTSRPRAPPRGLPGLIRAAATQTSTRSVLSGTMRSHSSAAEARDPADLARAEHALGDPARQPWRPAAPYRSRAARGGRHPPVLAVGHLHGQDRVRGEDPRRAGRRRRRQPVKGLGRVDVQGHAGQRGQQGRGPLGPLPGPEVAQRGGHRGQQFGRLGGFDQVGVGPLGQAVGAVGDLDGGGGHLDHRDRGRPRVALDQPADLEAAHVGQVHVEQDQFDPVEPDQRVPPGARLGHRVAGPPQPGPEQVALGLVVVDEQQPAGEPRSSRPPDGPRMAKASRSLVSSPLRSSAAARGGVATSSPVMTIAGRSAGSRRAARSRPRRACPGRQHQVDRRQRRRRRAPAPPSSASISAVGDAGQHRLQHLAEARVVVGTTHRADGRHPVRQAAARRWFPAPALLVSVSSPPSSPASRRA